MLDLVNIAFRNLFKRKTRTILTIIGIGIGVLSVTIIGIIGKTGTKEIMGELEKIGLGGISITQGKNHISSTPLNQSDLNTISKVDNVEAVMPLVTLYTSAKIAGNEENCLVWGIGSNSKCLIQNEMIYGEDFTAENISNRSNVCLIDEKYALETFGRKNIVGKNITVNFKGKLTTMKILGVVKSESSILNNFINNYIPQFVYVPYTTMQSNIGSYYFDQVTVKIKDTTQNYEKTKDEIVKQLNKANHTTNAYSVQDLSKQKGELENVLKIITLILSLIGMISVLVSGIGIMTIMLSSISERTKEIGIKKAIGAKKTTIMLEFLVESLLISLLGSLAGVSLSVLIAVVASKILKINIVIDLTYNLCVIILGTAIGGVFGAYPAYKASKLQPVEAFKNNN